MSSLWSVATRFAEAVLAGGGEGSAVFWSPGQRSRTEIAVSFPRGEVAVYPDEGSHLTGDVAIQLGGAGLNAELATAAIHSALPWVRLAGRNTRTGAYTRALIAHPGLSLWDDQGGLVQAHGTSYRIRREVMGG